MSSKTQQIPVIVVSGERDPATEATARGRGIAGFLHKAVGEDELSRSIDRAFGTS